VETQLRECGATKINICIKESTKYKLMYKIQTWNKNLSSKYFVKQSLENEI